MSQINNFFRLLRCYQWKNISFFDKIKNGAIIEGDRYTYRYVLWRIQRVDIQPIVIIMLTPSTGNEIDNDGTINNCIKISDKFGYGGIIIINIFALVTRSYKELKKNNFIVGPKNDLYIRKVVLQFTTILCAWGSFRDTQVTNRILNIRDVLADKKVLCIYVNKDASPRHPSQRSVNGIHGIPDTLIDYAKYLHKFHKNY